MTKHFSKQDTYTPGIEIYEGATGQGTSTSQAVQLAKQTVKAEIQQGKQAAQDEFVALVQELPTLNWREIKPFIVAKLLTYRPIYRKKEDPPRYLTFQQALVIAMGCYEDQLNPLGKEIWIDPDRLTYNATTEGKRNAARRKGLNLGAPRYDEAIVRPFTKVGGWVLPPGYDNDVGIRCRISIHLGNGIPPEEVSYLAWLSEWYVASSPMWQQKPMHMLQVRAQEKCISFASGVGVSDLPDEADIQLPTVTPSPGWPVKFTAPPTSARLEIAEQSEITEDKT